MRALTTFREPLRKNQIMNLAIEDVKNSIETAKSNPIETQIFFKRLKVYVDEFLKGNETHAIDDFNTLKREVVNGVNVSFTQGGAILDYSQDITYSELARLLKERKLQLDHAHRMSEAVWEKDVISIEIINLKNPIEVPKVKVKDYRKDSLNVRL